MAAGSFAVGIGLRPFLVNINRLTAAAIAEGGLFNAEETRDSRRWRTTQILHAPGRPRRLPLGNRLPAPPL